MYEKLKVEGLKVEPMSDKLLESIKSLNERLKSALASGDKAKADEIRKALKNAIYRGTGD